MKRLVPFLLLSWVLAGCAAISSPQQFITMPTPFTVAHAGMNDIADSLPPTAAVPALPAETETELPPPEIHASLTASPTPTPYVYAYGPTDFPPDINPLTGLPVDDPGILDRRPMVIKVTNFPRSVRPQWGLTLADNVFEYYIGDFMSRFIGVFYGKDASRVGPIRSARIFDEHVMRMYKGIFVFGYADDPVLDFFLVPELKSHLVVERPDNCPPLCRIGPKSAYNNLYADTSLLSQYITDRGTDNSIQNLNGMHFELAVPKSGNPGLNFTIEYSTVSYNRWEYDPSSGRYRRFQEKANDSGDGKSYAPLIDSLTGNQITADNVIVLRVPHEDFYKSTSTEIIDQPINGSGSGYAFRNGQIYPITWMHRSADGLFTLVLPEGKLYPLKPGITWFEVIGKTSDFTSQGQGSWDFVFHMP
jgi:hypothetical protein